MTVMRVVPIAWTRIDWQALATVIGETEFYRQETDNDDPPSDIDLMAEFAGRGCYLSWDRPNPQTASTETYLGHIQKIVHPNVFEHATVTFYVQDVSRSLLLELERHRFLSFSVESQRYVDPAKSHGDGPVIPIVMRGTAWEEGLCDAYQVALNQYSHAVTELIRKGHDRKTARGAARALLLESTATSFTLTANIRCWRDVIGMRLSPAADAEIREFAAQVLRHLRDLAPFSVQDL